MEFLKKIKWTPLNILKASVLLLVTLFVLTLIHNMFNVRGFSFDSKGSSSISDMLSSYSGDYAESDSYGYAEEEMMAKIMPQAAEIGIGVPPMPEPSSPIGNDAEDYEVTQYSASIESRDSKETCATIADLKSLDYVIFEDVNESERNCYFRFKVEISKVDEVLSIIESLDPKDLSENTYTIKQQVTNTESELEILQRKLDSINETLNTAIVSYDEITALATATSDAESLTKVINSKISTIERLTQQKINITAQIQRLARSQAQQLDRLGYVYFDINVFENKFIDGEYLKDSWKAAVKGFVRDINKTAQDVTINLIALAFALAKYILYFLILLMVAKGLWKFTKSVWTK